MPPDAPVGAPPGLNDPDPGEWYVLPPNAYTLDLSGAILYDKTWSGGIPWPFNEIINWLEDVYLAIRDFIAGNVVSPLINLWNKITTEINRLWDQLTRWLSDNFAAWLSWLRDRVGDLLTAARNIITSVVNNFWLWLGDRWRDITAIWHFVTVTLRDWIGARLGDLGNLIGTLLGNLGSTIGSLLGAVGRTIGDLIADQGQITYDKIALETNDIDTQIAVTKGLVTSSRDSIGAALNAGWLLVTTAVANGFGAVSGFVQNNLIDPIGDWFGRLGAWFGAVWEHLKAWMGGLLGQLGTWLSQIWNSDLIQGLINAGRSLLGWLWGLLQQGAAWVWGLIGTRVPRGPGGAPDAIQAALSSTLAIASGSAFAALGGQTVLPWLTGLPYVVKKSLKEVTDFSEINNRWVRPMFDAYLGQPTYYYFNSLFRNRLPSPSEFIGMVGEYVISPEEYMTGMGYYGIPDEWAQNMLALADRPVPLPRLVAMSSLASTDDAFVTAELENSSYNRDAIARMIPWINSERMMEGASRGIGTLVSLYRDGFYSIEQFRGQLVGLGYHPMTIEGFVRAARWIEAADWHADVLAGAADAYAKDTITEPEYRSRLGETGMNAQRVGNLVMRANLRKVPAPLRKRVEPPLPIYLRPEGEVAQRTAALAYEEGLIDRGTYIARLESWQMPHPLVAAYVDLADARRRVDELRGVKPIIPPYETDPGRLAVRTLLILWAKRQIGDSELTAGLRGLKMPSNLVAAYLANAKAQAYQPIDPDELRIPDLRAGSPEAILLVNSRIAYRRGDLDSNQLGDILIDLGYRPEDARAIIDAEDLIRQEPIAIPEPIIPPFEPRSPEAILFSTASSAYRQALIAPADYEAILVKLGYRAEDARLIRQAEDLVRKRTE